MAEQVSHWYEKYCHDLEVMSLNPSQVDLGVHSMPVLCCTWTKNILQNGILYIRLSHFWLKFIGWNILLSALADVQSKMLSQFYLICKSYLIYILEVVNNMVYWATYIFNQNCYVFFLVDSSWVLYSEMIHIC